MNYFVLPHFIIYSFRFAFPLLEAVPSIKRETEGARELEGGGDNVRDAAITGSVARSPPVEVDTRGSEPERVDGTPLDAARSVCSALAGGRKSC